MAPLPLKVRAVNLRARGQFPREMGIASDAEYPKSSAVFFREIGEATGDYKARTSSGVYVRSAAACTGVGAQKTEIHFEEPTKDPTVGRIAVAFGPVQFGEAEIYFLACRECVPGFADHPMNRLQSFSKLDG